MVFPLLLYSPCYCSDNGETRTVIGRFYREKIIEFLLAFISARATMALSFINEDALCSTNPLTGAVKVSL